MSCLFSVPHHVFPEKGDLVGSVSPHLSLEQRLEHRFQLEGEMSAEMAQHPSALSQDANSVDSPYTLLPRLP